MIILGNLFICYFSGDVTEMAKKYTTLPVVVTIFLDYKNLADR